MTDEIPASSAPISTGTGQTQEKSLPSPLPTTRTGDEMPAVGRKLFRSVSQELSDTDLKDPGLQKMLLAEIERIDSECVNLKGYVERFNEADKERAVLQEKLRTVTSIEVVFGAGMGIGGAMMGLGLSFPENARTYGYFLFGL